jgi:hypothetical protein
MAEGFFEVGGLRFERDLDGTELDGETEEVLCDLDPTALGLDPDALIESVEERLALLLGEPYEDDEGMYEFVVRQGDDGNPVACIVLTVEDDDTLSLAGERSPHISERTLATSLGKALRAAQDELDDEDD